MIPIDSVIMTPEADQLKTSICPGVSSMVRKNIIQNRANKY